MNIDSAPAPAYFMDDETNITKITDPTEIAEVFNNTIINMVIKYIKMKIEQFQNMIN